MVTVSAGSKRFKRGLWNRMDGALRVSGASSGGLFRLVPRGPALQLLGGRPW